MLIVQRDGPHSGLSITLREPDARLGERVEVRRLALEPVGAVAADAVEAVVVGEDEEDVGFRGRGASAACSAASGVSSRAAVKAMRVSLLVLFIGGFSFVPGGEPCGYWKLADSSAPIVIAPDTMSKFVVLMGHVTVLSAPMGPRPSQIFGGTFDGIAEAVSRTGVVCWEPRKTYDFWERTELVSVLS